MNAPFQPDTAPGAASEVILVGGSSEVASEIDRLVRADDPARAFLRQAWFEAREVAASEFVMARDSSGRPVIAFPLCTKTLGPFSVRQVAGAYWPFRGAPTDAECTAEELGQALADPSVSSRLGIVWRMGPVIDDDAQLHKLSDSAKRAGWTVLSRPVGSIFALDLAALTASGKWPSSKGQQKDRWRVRQLEKTGPVRIEHFTGVDWNNGTRDAIAMIESKSWVGQLERGGDTKFHDPKLRAVWEEVAQDPAIAAMIRGSLLYVGDTPAAFTFGLDCGATRYCIANNFDQQFRKYSPGRVLLYDDFTSAAARGITFLDWGLGDGGYKRQMGAEETSSVSDLLFVRGSLLSSILRPIWQR